MTPSAKVPDRLAGQSIDDYLWCGTFTRRGDGALERYYSTYAAITSTGLLAGTLRPGRADDQWFAAYKILVEFSGIAWNLGLLGLFEENQAMWYDALQAALSFALTHEAVAA